MSSLSPGVMLIIVERGVAEVVAEEVDVVGLVIELDEAAGKTMSSTGTVIMSPVGLEAVTVMRRSPLYLRIDPLIVLVSALYVKPVTG